MQYPASEHAESRIDNYLENNIHASRIVMNMSRGETILDNKFWIATNSALETNKHIYHKSIISSNFQALFPSTKGTQNAHSRSQEHNH
jgi:hypothetical protein